MHLTADGVLQPPRIVLATEELGKYSRQKGVRFGGTCKSIEESNRDEFSPAGPRKHASNAANQH